MIYRIAGGIFLGLLGLSMMGVTLPAPFWVGLIGLIAGIALLAGV